MAANEEETYSYNLKLGEGSFAKVYQASCKRTGAAKAIKIISAKMAKHGRPSMEVEILKRCQHPNRIALE